MEFIVSKQHFGVCCVIDSNDPLQQFADFVFVREVNDEPKSRCIQVTGHHLGIGVLAKELQFGFTVVDKANDPNVALTSLEIGWSTGPWLFQTNDPLLFVGASTGLAAQPPIFTPTQEFRYYRVIESSLLKDLTPFLDGTPLKFSVKAKITKQGLVKRYFADPEIGVETGGDQ